MFYSLTTKKILKTLLSVERRNQDTLNLTANQNTLSELAMRIHESPIGLRYDFGRGAGGVMKADNFGNFSAITYPELHDILDLAKAKAKKMLNAQEVNIECLSGAHAMLCALLGSTDPGDTIMSVREEDGGHFCTKHITESIGRKHVFAVYDLKQLTFDVQKTVQRFKSSGARVLYLDTSVLLRPHPIAELRKLLPKNAFIIYDASHTLGLIMGGMFQSPLAEGADLISANTHKTFPGPHKGILAFANKRIAQQMNEVIHNTYSTVHTNSLMALAVSIIEMDLFGKSYAQQIVKNSRALGLALQELGLEVRMAGDVCSHNHQVHMFIDLIETEAVRTFAKNNISISTSNALGGKTFIRFGTQEVTKRGMKEDDMCTIATLIKNTIDGKKVHSNVVHIMSKFRKAQYALPYSES